MKGKIELEMANSQIAGLKKGFLFTTFVSAIPIQFILF
jgi:hypothetical protein